MLFLLISIATLVFQFFFPWWVSGIIAFAFACYKAKSASQAFKSGFLALFVVWVGMGLVQTIPNDHLLANRIGAMFMLPADFRLNWLIILLVTGIIGGLAAAFSALAGFYSRRAFCK